MTGSGAPRDWGFSRLNACAWNCKVTRSPILMFLKTPRFTVLIGCPRNRLRPAPLKGEPNTAAAVSSLTIQCAEDKGVAAQSPPVLSLPIQPSSAASEPNGNAVL